jgi:hypothetical protein
MITGAVNIEFVVCAKNILVVAFSCSFRKKLT